MLVVTGKHTTLTAVDHTSLLAAQAAALASVVRSVLGMMGLLAYPLQLVLVQELVLVSRLTTTARVVVAAVEVQELVAGSAVVMAVGASAAATTGVPVAAAASSMQHEEQGSSSRALCSPLLSLLQGRPSPCCCAWWTTFWSSPQAGVRLWALLAAAAPLFSLTVMDIRSVLCNTTPDTGMSVCNWLIKFGAAGVCVMRAGAHTTLLVTRLQSDGLS